MTNDLPEMKCVRTGGPVRCDYPKDYPCCDFPITYGDETSHE